MTTPQSARPQLPARHVRNADRDTIGCTRIDATLVMILGDLDHKLQEAHRLVNEADEDRAKDAALEWAYTEIIEGVRITFNVQ